MQHGRFPNLPEPPRVDPVGLTVFPERHRGAPRGYPAAVRLAALVLAGVFAAVVAVTTAVSLGAYCLTTDAANTRALPESYLRPGS